MAISREFRGVGVVDLTSSGWAASGSYTRMTIHSLARTCPASGVRLTVLSSRDPAALRLPEGAEHLPLPPPAHLPGERLVRRLLKAQVKDRPFPGEGRLRRMLRLSDASDLFHLARQEGVSVVLPLWDVPPRPAGVATLGWIPDFQHAFLPQYFPESNLRRRHQTDDRLARWATIVMLSSRNALEHFRERYPGFESKARVVSFPSLFAFEPPPHDPPRAPREFGLPEKFALVCNQFWGHKNHVAVVHAVGRLRRRGLTIPIVMTGLPLDDRDPRNATISEVLQEVARQNVSGQVVILGQVEYRALVDLLRSAAVVIQPSRFEGWSTTVQDARALGRPVLCSDLPVHREQAPDALGFFGCDEPEHLADLLAAHWDMLAPGPDLDREQWALQRERNFAARHGSGLLDICREAYQLASTPGAA
jgi:glycosyltransferase involved in cell wall biosynthesis